MAVVRRRPERGERVANLLPDQGPGIRDQHDPQSGSQNNHQLRRRHEHPGIALFHDKSADNRGKDHDDTDQS
jgi:hypothetical protein